ncbi:uncharacterized protein METZ01_LOCUS503444, partial [marine metagenome]
TGQTSQSNMRNTTDNQNFQTRRKELVFKLYGKTAIF